MKINCKIVSGDFYVGRRGFIKTPPNELGLVMFYTEEGCNPYRVCVCYSDLEVING